MPIGSHCTACGNAVKRGVSPCPHCGRRLYWGAQGEAFKRGFPASLLRTYYGGSQPSIERKYQREAESLAQLGYAPMQTQYIKSGCAQGCWSKFVTFGFISGDSLQVTYRKVR